MKVKITGVICLMSKYLDKNGLAHLWERIQELVATCGGSGGGVSKSKFIPSISTKLDYINVTYDQHDALTLNGNNTTSGSIIISTTAERPSNARREIIRSIKSTVNQNIFSKMTGYEWEDHPSGTRNRIIIYFASTEPFTIAANTIEVNVLHFYDQVIDRSQICYVEGSCEEEGGGDINE